MVRSSVHADREVGAQPHLVRDAVGPRQLDVRGQPGGIERVLRAGEGQAGGSGPARRHPAMVPENSTISEHAPWTSDVFRGFTTTRSGFVMVASMRRSGVRLATALVVGATALIATFVVVAAPAAATARRTPAQTPPLPKAYALVDVDTGAVLAQQDSRSLRPPASTIKLLTALITSQHLTAA